MPPRTHLTYFSTPRASRPAARARQGEFHPRGTPRGGRRDPGVQVPEQPTHQLVRPRTRGPDRPRVPPLENRENSKKPTTRPASPDVRDSATLGNPPPAWKPSPAVADRDRRNLPPPSSRARDAPSDFFAPSLSFPSLHQPQDPPRGGEARVVHDRSSAPRRRRAARVQISLPRVRDFLLRDRRRVPDARGRRLRALRARHVLPRSARSAEPDAGELFQQDGGMRRGETTRRDDCVFPIATRVRGVARGSRGDARGGGGFTSPRRRGRTGGDAHGGDADERHGRRRRQRVVGGDEPARPASRRARRRRRRGPRRRRHPRRDDSARERGGGAGGHRARRAERSGDETRERGVDAKALRSRDVAPRRGVRVRRRSARGRRRGRERGAARGRGDRVRRHRARRRARESPGERPRHRRRRRGRETRRRSGAGDAGVSRGGGRRGGAPRSPGASRGARGVRGVPPATRDVPRRGRRRVRAAHDVGRDGSAAGPEAGQDGGRARRLPGFKVRRRRGGDALVRRPPRVFPPVPSLPVQQLFAPPRRVDDRHGVGVGAPGSPRATLRARRRGRMRCRRDDRGRAADGGDGARSRAVGKSRSRHPNRE